MNILPPNKQIEIIATLCEGVGQRAVSRLTGTDRKTVARLALESRPRLRRAARPHDGRPSPHRIECDELWAFVGKKQNPHGRNEWPPPPVGDQYTFIALASSSRAIIGYRTGKRDGGNTDDFIADLRERVIGVPEISTDGFLPYKPAIRAEFGNRDRPWRHQQDLFRNPPGRTEASRRYSPAQVVAVQYEVVSGVPAHISTSYVERSNLSLRMAASALRD